MESLCAYLYTFMVCTALPNGTLMQLLLETKDLL